MLVVLKVKSLFLIFISLCLFKQNLIENVKLKEETHTCVGYCKVHTILARLIDEPKATRKKTQKNRVLSLWCHCVRSHVVLVHLNETNAKCKRGNNIIRIHF